MSGARETETRHDGSRHPDCTSMQCRIVGACCYTVCEGRLIARVGKEEARRIWRDLTIAERRRRGIQR